MSFSFYIIWFFWDLIGPSLPIVISEDTTVITSPLTKDGFPDYEKFLRDYGRNGVTFENNAAVPFWQAMWPSGLLEEHQLSISQALGFKQIPSPNPSRDPQHREVSDAISTYLTDQYKRGLTDEEAKELLSEESQRQIRAETERLVAQATRLPWTNDQMPPLNDWIKAKDSYFDLLHETARRPKWWNPSPSVLGGHYEGTINLLLPGAHNLRVAAQGLGLRAMRHTGNHRHHKAWSDLMVCFQLSRFSSQGITLVDQLVGASIDINAFRQTVAVLQWGQPNAEFVRQVLRDLEKLQITCDVTRSWDLFERICVVEMVAMLATKHRPPTEASLPTILNRLSYLKTDWNYILKDVNGWVDRLMEIGVWSSPENRNAAISAFEDALLELDDSVRFNERLAASYLNSEVRSGLIADVVVIGNLPMLGLAIKGEDRAYAMLDLTRIAAGLAVYKADRGHYPEKLELLVPEIIEEIPLDPYSQKPFIYKRMPDGGYLLYSVFENGNDDGGDDWEGKIVDGEWVNIEEPIVSEESDMVVRVPMPKFELPLPPIFLGSDE